MYTIPATAAALGAIGLAVLAAPSIATAVSIPAPDLPDFSAASFAAGAPIDHPYFPLLPRQRGLLVAEGIDDEGEPFTESTDRRFAGPGPDILGVQTTRMLDLAYEDDLLVEKTFDYFAQDTAGNVWYLGEDVTNFVYDDEGNLIDTNDESAWRADGEDAFPGYIMPASLDIGFSYYQEFAPLDEALDQAVTWAIRDELEVNGVTYQNVLQVLESTAVEPGVFGFKYYASGIGLIREEEGLDRDLGNPELVFNLVSTTPIPLPASAALLLAGIAALAGAGLRRTGG